MNILAFFAHPDDETLLAGGTLALLARQGMQVHYLCATRGEGGELGEPPLCTREELGDVREQEVVGAVKALGGRSLTFLGHVDPTLGVGEHGEALHYGFTDNLTLLAGQVAASIQQFQPAAVFSHGSHGEYGHPGHILCYQAARIAVESLGEGAPRLYTIGAKFPGHPRPHSINPDDPAHLVVDITPALPQKEQAALCHRTQHALLTRTASQKAGHTVSIPEVLVRLESFHRAVPPWNPADGDPVVEALKPFLYANFHAPGGSPAEAA